MGVVAGVVGVLTVPVEGVVPVPWVVVGGAWVLAVVGVLGVLGVEGVLGVLGGGQVRVASWATWVAPVATAVLSVPSTPDRLEAELVSVADALATAAQSRLASAEETEFS